MFWSCLFEALQAVLMIAFNIPHAMWLVALWFKSTWHVKYASCGKM